MKIRGLLLFLTFLFVQSAVKACGGIAQRVYAGDIRYTINPSNPLECSVILTMTFDIPDSLPTDSVFIDWGDGNLTAVYATEIQPDSISYLINGASVLYKHVYEGSHIYDSVPSSLFYTIAPLFQYRLDYASNIINGQSADLRFYIEARVAIDTTSGFLNSAPVLPASSPEFAFTHIPFNQDGTFIDADGDSIVFDLISPLVNDNVEAPFYVFPNQACQNLGQSSSLSIDRFTGELSWSSPCQQGIFAITKKVSKYRNGRLLGSIMSDQYIVVSASSGISEYSGEKTVKIYPDPATSYLKLESGNPSCVTISDALGKSVLKMNVPSDALIDISGLENGIYFLRDEKRTYSAKFVKQ